MKEFQKTVILFQQQDRYISHEVRVTFQELSYGGSGTDDTDGHRTFICTK